MNDETMDNHAGQGLTEYELGWLAGVWDGEGSIMIQRYPKKKGYTYVSAISVANTSDVFAAKVIELLDKVDIRLGIHERTFKEHECRKTLYQLKTVKQATCQKFCVLLLPYLVSKKAQAKLMMRFLSARKENHFQGEEEAELFKEVKSLNKFGKKD